MDVAASPATIKKKVEDKEMSSKTGEETKIDDAAIGGGKSKAATALQERFVNLKKQEEEECTFTPKVGKKSRAMNEGSTSGIARQHELHQKAMTQKKKLKDMREKASVPKECTFKPRMSTANSKAARAAAERVAGTKSFERLYKDGDTRKQKLKEAKARQSDAYSFKPEIGKKARNIGKASSFLDRLAKSSAARKKRMEELQAEKDRRINSVATFAPKRKAASKKKKAANFDRLYRTGGTKERLRKAKEAKEAALKKLTFRPKTSKTTTKSAAAGSSIYDRLYQSSLKRSERRKTLAARQNEDMKKSCTFRPSISKKTGRRGKSNVFERMERHAKAEKERKERLAQAKIDREMAACSFVSKKKSSSSSTGAGSKPIWERLHKRMLEAKTDKKETTLEREVRENCRFKPTLSNETVKLLEKNGSSKGIWERLTSQNRKEILLKRDAEKIKREKEQMKQHRHVTKEKLYVSSSESIFDRLHKRAGAQEKANAPAPPNASLLTSKAPRPPKKHVIVGGGGGAGVAPPVPPAAATASVAATTTAATAKDDEAAADFEAF